MLLTGLFVICREKVKIPSSKPFITLQGVGRDATIITYNDTANSTGSTSKSATFFVEAANFTARNLTFQVLFNFNFQTSPSFFRIITQCISLHWSVNPGLITDFQHRTKKCFSKCIFNTGYTRIPSFVLIKLESE